MAATISLDTSSPPVISPVSSPSSNPNHPPLAPLITSSPAPTRKTSGFGPPTSHASKNRLSQYSNQSGPSRSRPPSHIFPIFHSSLSYTTVRDFAYSTLHPMHYGPPPEPSGPASGVSTPVSESQKRLSDPPTSWESRGGWGPGPWGGDGLWRGEQLAPIHFNDPRDGPPWSEDEDLQSPVVVSSRHKKHKSSGAGYTSAPGRGRGRSRREDIERAAIRNQENLERGFYVGAGEDGSERYYVTPGDEVDGHGDLVTYPPDQSRQPMLSSHSATGRTEHSFTGNLSSQSYGGEPSQESRSESDASSSASSPGMLQHDESRYSRQYQFTIASADEEMHGQAVALFDFQRENENELPLVEGQVIWVSYRHGQGWLVAEDPKTQESGLVPEEYVRLLRDIQGGWNSLTGGQLSNELLSPVGTDAGTPTQAEHNQAFGHAPTSSAPAPSNGYQQPVVSTFSTSSKDLHPYPQHLLGTQAGQAPPQIIHYHGQRGGSQANTPTLPSAQERESSRDRLGSGSAKPTKSEDHILPAAAAGQFALSPEEVDELEKQKKEGTGPSSTKPPAE